MKIFNKFAVVSFLALAACASPAPVTETEAARMAATCFGWPEQILDAAASMSVPARREDPMIVDFKNAKMVTISADGKCGQITPTQVVSGTPIYQLPMSSFTSVADDTPEQNGMYILWLLGEEVNGNRRFIGMKGGISVLEIPSGESPPERSGPIA